MFRRCANTEVFSEITPANNAVAIDEKLRGPRDVVSVFTRAFVQKIVSANNFGIRIGEERKCIARFFAEIARGFRQVDADRDRLHTRGFEFGEMLFDTP